MTNERKRSSTTLTSGLLGSATPQHPQDIQKLRIEDDAAQSRLAYLMNGDDWLEIMNATSEVINLRIQLEKSLPLPDSKEESEKLKNIREAFVYTLEQINFHYFLKTKGIQDSEEDAIKVLLEKKGDKPEKIGVARELARFIIDITQIPEGCNEILKKTNDRFNIADRWREATIRLFNNTQSIIINNAYVREQYNIIHATIFYGVLAAAITIASGGSTPIAWVIGCAAAALGSQLIADKNSSTRQEIKDKTRPTFDEARAGQTSRPKGGKSKS